MARPRLKRQQREILLTWLAADYDWRLILAWCDEAEIPQPSRAGASYYRTKYGLRIDELRKQRRDGALNTGLALKEERVERLKQHADALEKIKWVPDEKGRLWNEAAWRETLEDIAAEMGHRKQGVDITSNGESVGVLPIVALDYRTLSAPLTARPVGDPEPSGEVQVDLRGSAVRQDSPGQ
jgi:hypothetical protein